MPIGLIGITLLSMIAASAHEDTPRQARAHVHGAGEAFILLEGNDLFIQIAAPAANFRTPEGTLLSVADLSSSDMIEDFISLPSRAQCTFQSQQVEQEGYEGEDAGELSREAALHRLGEGLDLEDEREKEEHHQRKARGERDHVILGSLVADGSEGVGWVRLGAGEHQRWRGAGTVLGGRTGVLGCLSGASIRA